MIIIRDKGFQKAIEELVVRLGTALQVALVIMKDDKKSLKIRKGRSETVMIKGVRR